MFRQGCQQATHHTRLDADNDVILRSWPRSQHTVSLYAGQHYVVFVDESLRGFFQSDDWTTGYFCHAAVGIPEAEYASLGTAVAPIFEEYRELTRLSPQEFKHEDFHPLPFPNRHDIARRIASLIRQNGGFVSGFYTPCRSFVLERVRSSLLGEAAKLPHDIADVYSAAVQELRSEETGPGHARTIGNLLHLPMVAVGSMLSEFGCEFSLFYDPREKREDRAVKGFAEGLMQSTSGNPAGNVLRDIRVDRTSHKELGLQLADLLVGEIRRFFEANSSLLSHGALQTLITPATDEPIQAVIRTRDRTVKTGVITSMDEPLRDTFSNDDPGGRYVFPCFVDLLASGILTGYAATGTPRDLIVSENLIWDQADFDWMTHWLTMSDASTSDRV